jgi:hypothetical protein
VVDLQTRAGFFRLPHLGIDLKDDAVDTSLQIEVRRFHTTFCGYRRSFCAKTNRKQCPMDWVLAPSVCGEEEPVRYLCGGFQNIHINIIQSTQEVICWPFGAPNCRCKRLYSGLPLFSFLSSGSGRL